MDGTPLVLDDVHAQRAVAVNVGVEYLRGESHARRLLGILLTKRHAKGENTTCVYVHVSYACEKKRQRERGAAHSR